MSNVFFHITFSDSTLKTANWEIGDFKFQTSRELFRKIRNILVKTVVNEEDVEDSEFSDDVIVKTIRKSDKIKLKFVKLKNFKDNDSNILSLELSLSNFKNVLNYINEINECLPMKNE